MRSTQSLIEELKKFPEDSFCYAYEGEILGVVVVGKDRAELGYITAAESYGDSYLKTVIN